MQKIRIATRQSKMALVQAHAVEQALCQAHPGLQCEILPMLTEGDKQLSMPLATIGGKGLFLKELEKALLDLRADIAVHSLKDVTVKMPDGLALTAFCQRNEVRDALVLPKQGISLQELPHGARVGTSSLRRRCLVAYLRPDLQILNCRGNVITRFEKLHAGEYDALVLSASGLQRLNLAGEHCYYLDTDEFIPAVGQGTITIQARSDDARVHALVQALDHGPTRSCVMAERALNRALQGGCQVPIAGYARLQDDTLHITGAVGEPDGSRMLVVNVKGLRAQAEKLGEQVATELLAQGAGEILQRVYDQ